MENICQFLEVDPQFQFDFSSESNAASLPRFAGINKFLVKSGIVKTVKEKTPKALRKYMARVLYSEKGIPKLSHADRAWLVDWYMDDVSELSGLIGDDVFKHWPDFMISEKKPKHAL